ncbi:MAG: hypothetical protein IPH34_10630 [Chitinophagaceae bacterium]|nr:hypothetical protein [Chitinophagaceae bacterium]MBK8606966.1 hypothetical protein [Chitinophagaceae bacterium]MBP6478181.1 hypothetical protein [Chitinophagaceae bacterium]MBP7107840.1 hypothetical protein [Chitinophagaceae bacterium]MBP7314970.1 hypothetical protein [Chitinophagaceae bacterium]
MRKIFLTFIMFGFIYFSKAQTSDTDLRSNPLFIENVSKLNEVAEIIFNNYGKSKSSILEVKRLVEEIANSKGISDNEKADQMNSLLGLPQGAGIEYYATLVNNNWNSIKLQYGTLLTDSYIKNETEALMESDTYQNTSGRHANPCRKRALYILCSAAATSAAILCHAACTSTLFGMFACFGLCATGQTYAIAECYDTYCAPLAGN